MIAAESSKINGNLEVYDASSNRFFVAEIYGPLAVKGGPLGYGTKDTDSFPPHVS